MSADTSYGDKSSDESLIDVVVSLKVRLSDGCEVAKKYRNSVD